MTDAAAAQVAQPRATPWYAIRHKPTGGHLPEIGRKTTGGYTKQEPSLELPPRLFATRRAARNALTCWLRGRWEVKYENDEEWLSEIGAIPRPVSSRAAADMEVIVYILVPCIEERNA